MKRISLTTAFLLLIWSSCLIAAEYDYKRVDVPGAAHSLPFGLNDVGDIVGSFYEVSLFGGSKPYLYSDGQYYDIGVAGAASVQPFSLNKLGIIAGTFTNRGQFGFLQDDVNTTVLSDATRAEGVNIHGAAVGYLSTQDYNQFAYKYKNGVYKPVIGPDEISGMLGSAATGINDRGDIVGYYFYDNATGQQLIQGFVRKAGVLYPLAITPLGINNDGVIVGFSGAGYDAAVLEDGIVTLIKYPGADHTQVNGINNKGHIVGFYMQAGVYHGFIGKPVPLAKAGKP